METSLGVIVGPDDWPEAESPATTTFVHATLERLFSCSGTVIAQAFLPFRHMSSELQDPDMFQQGNSKDDFIEWDGQGIVSAKAVVRFPVNFFHVGPKDHRMSYFN